MVHLRKRLVLKLRSYTAKIWRSKVVNKMKKRNRISTCSIISSNCIGGLVSHDLNLRFDSPTVNLFFEAEDFLEFVENLKYYLSIKLDDVKVDIEKGYPVGILNDLKVHFVHYKTPEECIEKWETRRVRVDFNNLFIICTDRNGMTLELLKRYLNIPYRKIIFVSKIKWCFSKECIYIPGFENEKEVEEMQKYADWLGHRYYEKYFDIVKWLNGDQI